MAEFKKGDIVTVDIPNSPEMKINDLDAKIAVCEWFDANKCYQTRNFPVSQLKKSTSGTYSIK